MRGERFRFEVWVGGHEFGQFDTLREAERAAAERPPTTEAEIVKAPSDSPTWRPGDGERVEETVRHYPPVLDQS
jgi:hypothetical protein